MSQDRIDSLLNQMKELKPNIQDRWLSTSLNLGITNPLYTTEQRLEYLHDLIIVYTELSRERNKGK